MFLEHCWIQRCLVFCLLQPRIYDDILKDIMKKCFFFSKFQVTSQFSAYIMFRNCWLAWTHITQSHWYKSCSPKLTICSYIAVIPWCSFPKAKGGPHYEGVGPLLFFFLFLSHTGFVNIFPLINKTIGFAEITVLCGCECVKEVWGS